jgi:hypothetical protein
LLALARAALNEELNGSRSSRRKERAATSAPPATTTGRISVGVSATAATSARDKARVIRARAFVDEMTAVEARSVEWFGDRALRRTSERSHLPVRVVGIRRAGLCDVAAAAPSPTTATARAASAARIAGAGGDREALVGGLRTAASSTAAPTSAASTTACRAAAGSIRFGGERFTSLVHSHRPRIAAASRTSRCEVQRFAVIRPARRRAFERRRGHATRRSA